MHALHLPNQRTGEFADQKRGSIGRRFFVFGIDNAENRACILYQSMLKTASGAKEGNVGFPGKTDGIQCAFHADVRAAGRTPKGIEATQAVTAVLFNLGSWYPRNLRRDA